MFTASNNNTAEDVVKQTDMADKLKISPKHLRKLREDGHIPYIKAGNRFLYQPSKVISALEVHPTKQSV